MCCFSGKVRTVGKTRIFARGVEAGGQALGYQMNFDAEQEVAMILPLPVKLPIWEKAVRFVNLEGYDNFFEKLDKLFPQIVSRGRGVAETDSLAMKTLEVVQVGSYEASFVPTMEDFARLDNRFRIVPREPESASDGICLRDSLRGRAFFSNGSYSRWRSP